MLVLSGRAGGRDLLLALKDSFVGKRWFSKLWRTCFGFIITTEGLFLGLEKVNYESRVMILLTLCKIPGYKTFLTGFLNFSCLADLTKRFAYSTFVSLCQDHVV